MRQGNVKDLNSRRSNSPTRGAIFANPTVMLQSAAECLASKGGSDHDRSSLRSKDSQRMADNQASLADASMEAATGSNRHSSNRFSIRGAGEDKPVEERHPVSTDSLYGEEISGLNAKWKAN